MAHPAPARRRGSRASFRERTILCGLPTTKTQQRTMPHVLDGVGSGRSQDRSTERARRRTYGSRRRFVHATNSPTARREKDASRRKCADVTPPCRLLTDVARRNGRSGLDDRKLPLRRLRQLLRRRETSCGGRAIGWSGSRASKPPTQPGGRSFGGYVVGLAAGEAAGATPL